jgi:hypothetical protein
LQEFCSCATAAGYTTIGFSAVASMLTVCKHTAARRSGSVHGTAPLLQSFLACELLLLYHTTAAPQQVLKSEAGVLL